MGIASVILAASAILLPADPSPASTPAAPTSSPIVVIFMENKSASQVIDNTSMPYLNHFADVGLRFTNYHEGDPVGPSLPDYLQIAAGSSCGKLDNTTVPGDPAIGTVCPTTVWNQLQEARVTWGAYMEGMPSACSANVTYNDAATDGEYALKHNPATPFPSIWSRRTMCRRHVLPYSAFDVTALRSVSFISPNQCNDQHGSEATRWRHCMSGSLALLKRGDNWLAAQVPPMLRAGATVLITYDEENTLYAVARGPGIAPGTDATAYTHYSTLAAIEERFGLANLRGARRANVLPI
jgi:phospholipase C